MDAEDWERYALEDPTKNYTRNLVASDGTSYTLLVLVWTPGKSSHVHDHPCDGCWMRVLKGVVRERRYRPSHRENLICCGGKQEEEDRDDGGPRLECFQDGIYREEDKTVVFIEDFLGFHKVENPSSTEPAVTLHLYSPPFDRCRVWIDESSASSASESCCARYDSVHGERMCDGSNTGDNLGLLHPV
jgi:cysteine dioxygenase